MELKLSYQNYHWGKIGNLGIVSKLVSSNNSKNINEKEPFAELWMGIHPNGPSFLKHENTLLSDFITNNPTVLGPDVVGIFGNTLPYLFKVLSIQTALSIQAHPSKDLAEKLFIERPNIYKDPNHKPELAIALTEFEALCGFKEPADIEGLLRMYPETYPLLFANNPELEKTFVSSHVSHEVLFRELMKVNQQQINEQLPKILNSNVTSIELDLLKRLNTQFPGDVGIFCVFFLNYVVLKPGEALYLAANEPHAYLSGDCVECMANSDNVVRAGLTPKFRDVETLCSMLTYKTYSSESVKFQPLKEDAYSLLFTPPVKDFAVAKITLPAGVKYSMIPRKSASIILALDGCSMGSSVLGEVVVKEGVSLFLPSNEVMTLQVTGDQTIYQAFCNV